MCHALINTRCHTEVHSSVLEVPWWHEAGVQCHQPAWGCSRTLVMKLYLSIPFSSNAQPSLGAAHREHMKPPACNGKYRNKREFLNKSKQTTCRVIYCQDMEGRMTCLQVFSFPCPLRAEELKSCNCHWSTKVFLCWKGKVCNRNGSFTWRIDNSYPNDRLSSS